tara:strand:- start:3102 stop:3584 length:483 start_codon:yes stop_codon:yes gene_type:complete
MSKNILINLVDRLVANSPIIKEQFSDDPNTFSTQVDDVDFSGLQQYFPEYQDRDMDVSYLDCVVNWRYDLDVRSWGIKDISVYTTSVVIRGTIEIYDEDYTGVEVEKEIELYVDDMGGFQSDTPDTWHYEDEKDNERYHTILPTNLQIDLEDKSIIVGWN